MTSCLQVLLLTAQIADRIRPICPNVSEADLQALAAGMAGVEHKYATMEFPRCDRTGPGVPSPLAPAVQIS